MDNYKGATITTITLDVAKALCAGSYFDLVKFAETGDANDYIIFNHCRTFYSYPEFGKQWTNGQMCQPHRVQTQCHICGHTPERNFAGVGSLFLLNNGVGNDEIPVVKDWQMKQGKRTPIVEWVANTPRLSRMIILCENHIKSYRPWRAQKVKKGYQLQLF